MWITRLAGLLQDWVSTFVIPSVLGSGAPSATGDGKKGDQRFRLDVVEVTDTSRQKHRANTRHSVDHCPPPASKSSAAGRFPEAVLGLCSVDCWQPHVLMLPVVCAQ